MTTFVNPVMLTEPFDLSGRTLTLPAGSVGSAALAANAVTLAKLPAGVFTSDATGRGKFAASFVDRGLVSAGAVVQQVGTVTGAVSTGTGTFSLADSAPSSSGGTEFLSQFITPIAASDLLVIEAVVNVSQSVGAGTMIVALFLNADTSAIAVVGQAMSNSGVLANIKLTHRMVAGTTGNLQFKVRVGFSAAATVTLNVSLGSRLFGGVCASSLNITEIKA